MSIDLIVDNVKAKDCPKLTRETFEPRGCTPLNDAIGRTVAKIDGEKRRDGENIAFVILTDGQENASQEYTKDAVKKLLDGRQKDKNWLVIYLGANQDAFAEGVGRGFAGFPHHGLHDGQRRPRDARGLSQFDGLRHVRQPGGWRRSPMTSASSGMERPAEEDDKKRKQRGAKRR